MVDRGERVSKRGGEFFFGILRGDDSSTEKKRLRGGGRVLKVRGKG